MTTHWNVPGSPWWWDSNLGQLPHSPGPAAQTAFRRQLLLAAEDARIRHRGPIDVGRQQQLPDGGACWGDACHARRPGPRSGPEIDADPLGLCDECRGEIVP